MVKNSYYYSPHFDLKSATVDNIDTKSSSGGMQLGFVTTSPVKFEEIIALDLILDRRTNTPGIVLRTF